MSLTLTFKMADLRNIGQVQVGYVPVKYRDVALAVN